MPESWGQIWPEILAFSGAVLSLIGAFFFLATGVGLLRLPDLFSRMHAPTKAGSLGLSCLALGSLLTGTASGAASGFHWLKDLLLLLVVFLTLPVAAQVLAKSARLRLGSGSTSKTPGDSDESAPTSENSSGAHPGKRPGAHLL